MSGYLVLGRPARDIETRYRGLDRSVPTFHDGSDPLSPGNAVLQELLDDHDINSRIWDLAAATRLAEHYGTPDQTTYELIEVAAPSERPVAGQVALGYDVTAIDALHSLLADVLLFTDPFLEVDPAAEGSRVQAMRDQFAQTLNENGLFARASDANAFLRLAHELGPWEGPEFSFEVTAVWLVPNQWQRNL